jgi:hypothetical protein
MERLKKKKYVPKTVISQPPRPWLGQRKNNNKDKPKDVDM